MVQMPELIAGYQNALNELAQYDLYVLARTISSAKRVFIAGNGGSASTGSHFAADLRRVGVEAICLCDNIARVTALANDFGYEEIFAGQLENLGREDVLVVISASGNSANLVKAVSFAIGKGARTIGLIGFGGGKLAELTDRSIILSSKDYGEVEGVHSCLCHIIPNIIRKGLPWEP